jgi:hypothetical protein
MMLTPAGVISGRIRDRDGDPLGAVAVQALVPVYQDGQRVMKQVQAAFTNDLGEYRLFGLMPGQYFLNAMPGLAALSVLRSTLGTAGPDQLRLYLGTGVNRADNGSGTTYLPIYYPGTADVRSATSLDLIAGANLGGVDFIAGPVATRHVRGTVAGGGASVSLVPLDAAAANLISAYRTSTVDGPFDLMGVAPGTYLLIANSGDLAGSIRLEVRDADVDNVTLRLGNPIVIPTHVSFDDRVSSGNDPDLDLVRLRLIPDPPVAKISGDTYSPFPDGSMGFQVLAGESYRIKLDPGFDPSGKLRNAYIKSIRMGTRDVLNDGLQFGGDPNAKIEVLIGMKPGSLSGIVMATVRGKLQPVVNTTVVLVPDAARRRRPEVYRTAATDGGGRFQMTTVDPGDYRVFAWDDVENGAWQDPEFIRLYEDQGTPVHIGEGGKNEVSVTLQ